LIVSGDLSDAVLDLRSKALRAAGVATLQEVRDSLKRYRTAIPEFVARCKKESVWAPSPPGAQLNKGISLFHLATFSMSLGGTEVINKFYEAIEIELDWDIDRQVAIAKEVAARCSR
jgi:hypothetical protein